MSEEWRKVPGFPYYSVSSEGRVRRDVGGQGTRAGHIMKPAHDSHGYPLAILTVNAIGHTKKVHRLLAEAFLGPKPDWAECVAHNDGDPKNCVLANLRWSTLKDNQKDRLRHGTHARGEKNPGAKLTVDLVREARRRRRAGEGIAALAREYGVNTETLGHAIRGANWGWVDG